MNIQSPHSPNWAPRPLHNHNNISYLEHLSSNKRVLVHISLLQKKIANRLSQVCYPSYAAQGLAILPFCHSLTHFSVEPNTVAIWTQNQFTPLLIRPQGSQGCQKIMIFISQIKLLSFCAKINSKLPNFKTSSKLKKKLSKNIFLQFFQILICEY